MLWRDHHERSISENIAVGIMYQFVPELFSRGICGGRPFLSEGSIEHQLV